MLCVISTLVTISATIIDTMSSYMLYRTDFSRCLHTDTHITVDCDTEICSNLNIPPNTCYCCYLYRDRKAKGCDTPFLLDKSAYFIGVESCDVIPKRLYPMVTAVGLLSLLSTILNLVFFFKSRPVRYYVKTEKGDMREVEDEGERGVFRNALQKLKSKKSVFRNNVKYSIAKTEDTVCTESGL